MSPSSGTKSESSKKPIRSKWQALLHLQPDYCLFLAMSSFSSHILTIHDQLPIPFGATCAVEPHSDDMNSDRVRI